MGFELTGGLNKMGTSSTPKLQNDDNQQPRGVRIPYFDVIKIER